MNTRRASLFISALALTFFAHAGSASARDVEAGAVSANAAAGVGIRLGSAVEGSTVFAIQVGGEYAFTSMLAGIVDLGIGLGSATPLRLHLGARARMPGLDWPVIPYAQIQLSAGQLLGALGANLWWLGARLGVGADYPLTANWSAGLLLAADLGSTLGPRPAFYGLFDVLIVGGYTF